MLDDHLGIVCLIPSDGLPDEHLTVIFTNRPTENFALDQMVKFIATGFMPMIGSISGHADFGDRGEYQVATVLAPQIYDVWRLLSHFHMSKWDFNPHISAVNNRRRVVGSLVKFDRIGIWDENVGKQINYRFGVGSKSAPTGNWGRKVLS